MLFRQIFDPKLAQYAYLIGCQKTGEAVIVDPERDIDRYVALAESEGLRITAVAETHIHADFLSGSREFAERFDTMLYLSDEGDADWKYEWVKQPKQNGDAVRYQYLKDGDVFNVGKIAFTVVHTPGHTPEHISFLVTDYGGGATTPMGMITGDFVFVGDLGRPDLLEQAAGMHGVQEPSARTLFASLPRFTEQEGYVQVWPAHGAGSTCGKALGAVPVTTVGYEKLYNASLAVASQGEQAFVNAILAGQPEPQMYFARMKRDNKLGAPVLGGLPNPRKVTATELARIAKDGKTLIVDARLDRSGFMARHIPGSLYAPLNKAFNTVIGSLVTDETTPLLLIVEESGVDEAVRDLVRIGYDNVVAFADSATLERYFTQGGAYTTIPEIKFNDLPEAMEDTNNVVVDVRFAAEYAASHVPGAVNASYTRLPQYVEDRIPAGKTLLVHCASGGRSAASAAFLSRLGYPVQFVNGTFEQYASNHTVVSEEEALVG